MYYPIGGNQVIFVTKCAWKFSNKVEQTIVARRNMSAVLNAKFRPEAHTGGAIALVKQGVERFENERLVIF